MRRYHGGSRSPKGGRKWISKAIVKMGRYEEGRPRGFNVDAEGAFKLSNLMSAWGRKASLTEERILDELQKNSMRGNGEPRFSMMEEAGGDFKIWVLGARRRRDREDLEHGGRRQDRSWPPVSSRGSSSAQLQPASSNLLAAEQHLDQLDKAMLATQAQNYAARGTYLEATDLRLYASDPLCMVSAPSAARPRPSSRPQPSQTPKPASSTNSTVDLTGDDEPKGGAKAPRPPPGKHWTMYHDDGDIWWFYEGPKGTWWMSSEHGRIQRWM